MKDKQNTALLPGNVKLLGAASLLNDVASEMIFPLLPTFSRLARPSTRTVRDNGADGWAGLSSGLAESDINSLRLSESSMKHARPFAKSIASTRVMRSKTPTSTAPIRTREHAS